MGLVTTQCALSGLPIDRGTRVRVLLLHAMRRERGRLLYDERSWVVRSAALPAAYTGYLAVALDDVSWARLAHEGLALELVVRPVGPSPVHDVRVGRRDSLPTLLGAAMKDRLTVRLLGERDPTPQTPPATIPTWRRVEHVLRDACLAGRAFPMRPYPHVVVDDCDWYDSGEARRAWSDRVVAAMRGAGWRAQHADANPERINVIAPERAATVNDHRVVVSAPVADVFGWLSQKYATGTHPFNRPPRRVGLALVRENVWHEATRRAGYETVTRRNLATIHRLMDASSPERLATYDMLNPLAPERPGLLGKHDKAAHMTSRLTATMAAQDAGMILGGPMMDSAHAGLLWQLARAQELAVAGTWSGDTMRTFLGALAETATVMRVARDVERPWQPSEVMGGMGARWEDHECVHAMWSGIARQVRRGTE